jgi:hypothetical protein
MKRPNYEPVCQKGTTMHYILARLTEQSTWRGLVLLAGAFGVVIEPELERHIVAAAFSIVGIINVVRKEKK